MTQKESPFPSSQYELNMRSMNSSIVCFHVRNIRYAWEATVTMEGKVLDIVCNGKNIDATYIEEKCKPWLSQDNRYGVNNRVAAQLIWDSIHSDSIFGRCYE